MRNINDLDTYQGSEYQFIGIDELTQLERFKYIYMCSRVRKTKDNKLPTQLMCSSNLGKRGNKWVRERFIEKIDTDIQDKSQIRFISSSYLDNVYLDRKFKLYEFFKNGSRSVKEFAELQLDNIGESPKKDNTEINSETKESESSYSIDLEPDKSE